VHDVDLALAPGQSPRGEDEDDAVAGQTVAACGLGAAEEPRRVNAPDLQMSPLSTPPMRARFDPEQGIRASMREHAEPGGIA